MGAIEGDNCRILIDLVLDVYIFAPTVGCTLRGIVNKKSPDGVGCLVHKGFNVAIPRPWGGTNHDWPGNFLEIGQDVMLQVEVLNFGKALPYIRGKLITDEHLSIQIHKKKKKKSKHKLQPLEGEPSEVREDSARIQDTSPQKKKKKDKLGLENMIDFSSVSNEVLTSTKKEKKMKSKHKLHSIEGESTEVRGDLALTEGSSPPHKKNKIELKPMIDFSSTTHEVSANQEEKKKKKSKHKLHSIEGESTEVRGDLALTEGTLPPYKKNKMGLEIDFSSTTHEISANQKDKKKKKSKHKLHSIEGEYTEVRGDLALTEGTSPPHKKNKMGLEIDFSSTTHEVSANQEKKKKKKSKHKLHSIEGELTEVRSDLTLTEESPRQKKKSKDKSELEPVVGFCGTTHEISANQKTVDELPLVQMKKKKKKSKDRFEDVELIKPSVTAKLSTQDITKHSDTIPIQISRSIPTIFTGDTSVGDLSTPTLKRKQVEALPYAVGLQEKEHRKKRSKHTPVGDTIQSTTGGHKSKSSESTPNNVECNATEDLERTLLKQSVFKTKLNSTNNQPGSTHPSLKSTNQVTSSSSSSSDGEFTVPNRNQPESLKPSIGLVKNTYTSNLQTTAQSSSSSSEDDIPMPIVPNRNQPESLKPSIGLIKNTYTSNLQTTAQSSSSSSEDDIPMPSVPNRNQPESLKPSVGLIKNNFTSNLQTTALSSSSSSEDDVPMPSVPRKNQPESLKPSIGLVKNNFSSNLQTTAQSSSSSSENDVPMPSVPKRNQQESKKTNLPTRVHSSPSSTYNEIPKTKLAGKKTVATSKKRSRKSDLPSLAVSSKQTAQVACNLATLATQLLDDFFPKINTKSK